LTNEERATLVVPGFHGLQLYANQFWVDHLRSYCIILGQQGKPLSHELLGQLTIFLGFEKYSADVGSTSDHASLTSFEVLDQHPAIKALVSKVIKFRAGLETEDASNKSDKVLTGKLMQFMDRIYPEAKELTADRYLFGRLLFRSNISQHSPPPLPVHGRTTFGLKRLPIVSLNRPRGFAKIFRHLWPWGFRLSLPALFERDTRV
jgi:hypothetical protein